MCQSWYFGGRPASNRLQTGYIKLGESLKSMHLESSDNTHMEKRGGGNLSQLKEQDITKEVKKKLPYNPKAEQSNLKK